MNCAQNVGQCFCFTIFMYDYQYNYNLQRIYFQKMNQNTKVEPHILKKFDLLKKIGSGAYGHVWKVQQKFTRNIYALKKIFDAFQHSTDAQRTYREINILKQLNHDNIIKLKETIKAENGKDIYLIFEYMQADLHNVIAEGILKKVHNKYIIYQIAKSLKYLHSAKLIHRDLKPSNILLNSNCLVKICDFGLVRCVKGEESSNQVMTQGVATRWYRAPEVLLGSKTYEYPADVWSFGCIIYQIFFHKPLFNGNSTLEQLQKIIQFTGFPNNEDINSLESEFARTMINQTKLINQLGNQTTILKDSDEELKDLILNIITINPQKRFSIEQILGHSFLKQFRKIEEQKICPQDIKTELDDDKKLNVQDYRNLLYKSPRTSNSKPMHIFNKSKKSINQSKNEKNNSQNQTVINKSSENVLRNTMNNSTNKLTNSTNITTILKKIKSAEYIVHNVPVKVQSLISSPNQSKAKLNFSKPTENKKILNDSSNNAIVKNKQQIAVGGPKQQLKSYLNQLNFNPVQTNSSKMIAKAVIKKPLQKENITQGPVVAVKQGNVAINQIGSPKSTLYKAKIGFNIVKTQPK